ncbi:MAG: LamG domain-containing protein [Candidatus Poribacteria bacterium]
MFRSLGIAAAMAGMLIATDALSVGQDMLVYLRMDDIAGDVVVDASGNGRDGVVTGAADVVAGKMGSALSVADADEIVIADDPALDGMDALTIEMWVWMETQQATGLIEKGKDWGVNMSYLVQPWSDGNIYFGIHETASRAITAPGDFPLSEWYHLAAVFDGGNLRLYIDGELKSEAPSVVDAVPDTEDPVQIGNRFTGLMDDFVLYDRALTAEEIAMDMSGAVLTVDSRGKLATLWGSLRR